MCTPTRTIPGLLQTYNLTRSNYSTALPEPNMHYPLAQTVFHNCNSRRFFYEGLSTISTTKCTSASSSRQFCRANQSETPRRDQTISAKYAWSLILLCLALWFSIYTYRRRSPWLITRAMPHRRKKHRKKRLFAVSSTGITDVLPAQGDKCPTLECKATEDGKAQAGGHQCTTDAPPVHSSVSPSTNVSASSLCSLLSCDKPPLCHDQVYQSSPTIWPSDSRSANRFKTIKTVSAEDTQQRLSEKHVPAQCKKETTVQSSSDAWTLVGSQRRRRRPVTLNNNPEPPTTTPAIGQAARNPTQFDRQVNKSTIRYRGQKPFHGNSKRVLNQLYSGHAAADLRHQSAPLYGNFKQPCVATQLHRCHDHLLRQEHQGDNVSSICNMPSCRFWDAKPLPERASHEELTKSTELMKSASSTKCDSPGEKEQRPHCATPHSTQHCSDSAGVVNTAVVFLPSSSLSTACSGDVPYLQSPEAQNRKSRSQPYAINVQETKRWCDMTDDDDDDEEEEGAPDMLENQLSVNARKIDPLKRGLTTRVL